MTLRETPPPAAGGAVYDRGYRPYEGERLGRAGTLLALWRVSMRRAVGLRRSWRQKVFPWSLLGIATVPAIVQVGVAYITRDTPAEGIEFTTFREYVGFSNTLLLFVALTAPDIVCPDRRNRVLPLIFARPLTGRGYVAAKVGALFAILFGFSFLPQVVLFVGQMLVAPEGSLDYFTENAEALWQVPLAVALFALYLASVGVALAATTTRRVVGGVAFLAVGFISMMVSSILVQVRRPDVVQFGAALPFNDGSAWGLLNVFAIPLYLRDVIFLGKVDPAGSLGGVPNAGIYAALVYVAVVGVSFAYLLRRYREVG